MPETGYQVSLDGVSVIAEAVQSRALRLALGREVPRTASALAEDALSEHSARLPETAAEVVLPLVSNGAIVGAVDMHISDLTTFYRQSLGPLKMMADQIALAVASHRQLERTRSALDAEREMYGEIDRRGWLRLLESGVVPGFRLQGHQI